MILLDQITRIDFLFFFSAKMRMKLLEIVVVLLALGSSDARPQRTGKNLSSFCQYKAWNILSGKYGGRAEKMERKRRILPGWK